MTYTPGPGDILPANTPAIRTTRGCWMTTDDDSTEEAIVRRNPRYMADAIAEIAYRKNDLRNEYDRVLRSKRRKAIGQNAW
jgi:hypothetical protein